MTLTDVEGYFGNVKDLSNQHSGKNAATCRLHSQATDVPAPAVTSACSAVVPSVVRRTFVETGIVSFGRDVSV